MHQASEHRNDQQHLQQQLIADYVCLLIASPMKMGEAIFIYGPLISPEAQTYRILNKMKGMLTPSSIQGVNNKGVSHEQGSNYR